MSARRSLDTESHFCQGHWGKNQGFPKENKPANKTHDNGGRVSSGSFSERFYWELRQRGLTKNMSAQSTISERPDKKGAKNGQ